ncbi:DnaD domain protein [Lactobacillus sp. LC28-10]|uniref:DnaD domain protein n=1 Tax=Secundilactobacillus angelensis TaxID=2722706 RepID=A0ABX1KV09_9LACO|nr:DnaD domain protein [Secundilactobacillus angelensis]MCH5461441.1 DnaD domain protein [Secundilactobacillus angelensis]NLR17746.1 DnaD domain protein [Secundilactobacillus angelensis]
MDAFSNALIKSGQTNVATLLLEHYRELGMSNTEFLIYLQIKSYNDRGISFPQTETIAKSVGLTDNQIFQELHTMIGKRLMQIDTVQQPGQLARDSYDFTLLYEKLAQYVKKLQTETVTSQVNNDRETIFNQIETEFGRPLSPIELEMISQWLDKDHYQVGVIRLALKEAVLNQVYNLKYMDRILLSWQKKHLTTPEQVQQEREHRQQNQAPTSTNKSLKKQNNLPDIPIFKIGEKPKQ